MNPLQKHIRQRGFSLIELSVVLILIGVVFMVVFPQLSGLFSGRKLRGFCRELAGYLDYARARAVIEGRNVTVHIDRNENKYWMTREDDGGDEEEEEAGRPAEPVKKQFPKRISVKRIEFQKRVVDRFQPVIRFYPRGNSNGAKISLETEQGDTATIRVKSYTGRSEVTVEE